MSLTQTDLCGGAEMGQLCSMVKILFGSTENRKISFEILKENSTSGELSGRILMELLLFEMLMMKFRLFQSVDGNLVLVTGNGKKMQR